MKTLTEAKPYSYMELQNNRYGVQNMELGSYNFPWQIANDDFDYSFYTDRLGAELHTAFWALNRETFGCPIDSWAPRSGAAMLDWAKKVFLLVNPGNDQEITGCRIVRYTDGGGYPIHRIDFVGVKPQNANRPVSRKSKGRMVCVGDKVGFIDPRGGIIWYEDGIAVGL